jgi:hypothetical protein
MTETVTLEEMTKAAFFALEQGAALVNVFKQLYEAGFSAGEDAQRRRD